MLESRQSKRTDILTVDLSRQRGQTDFFLQKLFLQKLFLHIKKNNWSHTETLQDGEIYAALL
jgi:hypothetical protein